MIDKQSTIPELPKLETNEPAPIEVIDISASTLVVAGDDARPTNVLNVPASISAASLRQALRQFDRGRVIVVIARKGQRDPAEPAASRAWAEQQREGLSSPEGGLVLVQSLRRQADAQGLDVALVTRDGKLRQQAEEAGIPVLVPSRARRRASGASRRRGWTIARRARCAIGTSRSAKNAAGCWPPAFAGSG